MYDALIVGGGPAGAAAAIELAGDGYRVGIVERDPSPQRKPCGGLLTPRAAAAVTALGVPVEALGHRVEQVRLTRLADGRRRRVTAPWPEAAHAFVTPRERLDAELLDRASGAGAELLAGHTAVEPVLTRGFVRGVRATGPDGRSVDLASHYVIVADGANSRFGRELGTYREPSWPHALAHRGLYRAGIHEATEAEIVVGVRDPAGVPIAGYAWMYPRGDGLINVGVLALSTSPSFQVLNLPRLLDTVVAEHGPAWQIDGPPIEPPAGGRLPMGASVGPAAGPTYLVAGDAAGVANPISGAGLEYAIDTGRLAGTVVCEALAEDSAAALQRYPQLLDQRYGTYFRVGRLASRLMGSPQLSNRLVGLATNRRWAAEAYLELATGVPPKGWRPARVVYRVARAATLVTSA